MTIYLDENTIQYIKIAKVNYEAWLYVHFSLVIGKTAVGVGIKDIISTEQGSVIELAALWLICISLTISLILLTILQISHLKVMSIDLFIVKVRYYLEQ